ncbi:MAG TPA: type I restriction-modification system subunit M N-terminal domain-containing protein, partial [Thermoanaerobaculia bacterium]|nr:type I restriction-modification system subunit M N-terminal domain-containing protein [Thermoanaerobaculia bacterium]
MSDVVQKLWGFCHTLRHDGIDYGDYIEQITYLLFLKMADERGINLAATRSGAKGKERTVDCSWPALAAKSGPALTEHYQDVLSVLSQQTGLLGDIFTEAMSRFKSADNLKRLIGLIDETAWIRLEVDVKAAAFEGLLEKA